MRRARPVLALLLLLSGACAREEADQVVPLDAGVIATYLEAYAVIGPAYRKAYEAGASPSAIPERADIRGALEKAGWSWEKYQSVHGSVSNALLYIEDRAAFERLELKPSDAPPGNVRAVEKAYYQIKRARLIGEEETYDRGGPPGNDG